MSAVVPFPAAEPGVRTSRRAWGAVSKRLHNFSLYNPPKLLNASTARLESYFYFRRFNDETIQAKLST